MDTFGDGRRQRIIGASSDTHEEVRTLGDVRGELVVVDPDTGRITNGDAVVVVDVADLEVPQNHIGAILHVNATACDVGCVLDADDGLV